MIWGTIKLGVFLAVAMFTGLLCATVPIGGKTLAARAQALWAEPAVKRQVGVLRSRVERGVAAATSEQDAAPSEGEDAPAPPHATRVDPHAVAKVVTDAPPGDAFRPSERAAVQHLIAQRSRELGRRGR